MNYSHVIETLHNLGIKEVETRYIRTMTDYIPDGLSFHYPKFGGEEKALELRDIFPNFRIHYDPNASKIFIEER